MTNFTVDKLKSSVRRLLRTPPAGRATSWYLSRTCNVIYLHIAGDDIPPHYRCFAPGRCDMASLASDLEELARRFRFVSLEEAMQPARERRPRLTLTIDDGLDFYTDALVELLDGFGIEPCLFLITGCIDNPDLMWRHKLSAIITLADAKTLTTGIRETWPGASPPENAGDLLRASFRLPHDGVDAFITALWEACGLPALSAYLEQYRPYLTWKRIEALRGAGFSFGSHSHTHPAFDLLDREAALSEMHQSRTILEQRLGLQACLFAYPFGRLPDRRERAAIHRAGGYAGYFGTYGFSRAGGADERLYQRISVEGSLDSLQLAPLYPFARFYQRLRGHGNPRI